MLQPITERETNMITAILLAILAVLVAQLAVSLGYKVRQRLFLPKLPKRLGSLMRR